MWSGVHLENYIFLNFPPVLHLLSIRKTTSIYWFNLNYTSYFDWFNMLPSPMSVCVLPDFTPLDTPSYILDYMAMLCNDIYSHTPVFLCVHALFMWHLFLALLCLMDLIISGYWMTDCYSLPYIICQDIGWQTVIPYYYSLLKWLPIFE